MGAGPSKENNNSLQNDNGFEESQLYVSLKMQVDDCKLLGSMVPHVYGSAHIVGSWDPSKARAMEREATSMWELSFVVPADHELLDFQFLLKPKDGTMPDITEEGSRRLLSGGNIMHRDAGSIASFKLPTDQGPKIVEFPVFVKADRVSPFSLAASWRGYKENLQSQGSMVRGIPDVSINSAPPFNSENSPSAYTVMMQESISHALELDLAHYEVPTPTDANLKVGYEAEKTEDPRSLGIPSLANHEESPRESRMKSALGMDLSSLWNDASNHTVGGESKLVGTDQQLLRVSSHQGFFVERGVGGSPRPARSESSVSEGDVKHEAEPEGMPKASGAVAAAAVADRMHGPKEQRQLAIILVGLPARGKTFTAAKITRYMRWLGHDTKHFNVGKYRRIKLGVNQTADFFSGDNEEAVEVRNEVAALAMEDMLLWMKEGGKVGVFDATNSTRKRRNMLLKMAEGKCKVIFLETICNDQAVIDKNIRLKIQQSPDYADETDYEAGLRDFKARLANYSEVYEPVEEGSYIKMIDTVSEQGGQLQVNNISGYLPGRLVFFLVNAHLTPRPIFMTRHGESLDNVRGRIGGDRALSEAGENYALKLADFINRRVKNERTASIWTSTLQRTLLTARHIVGFPKVQWRSLDEINAGVCEGMTYEEIKKNMPEEYNARKADKLRYRYPRGESYLDIIQRLEPVIIELERQHSPVVVISHQAVLRALYAYFADRPLEEIPHIEVPLHTIIEIQMGVTGVQEKRYKLMETSS